MCLRVDMTKYADQKKKYCKGKRTIVGYKVMKRAGNGKVKSFIMGTLWDPKKEVFDSGRKSNYPCSCEKYKKDSPYIPYDTDINKGFHFYRIRDIAREELSNQKRWRDEYDFCIIKFEIDVNDVVAFEYDGSEFVARKCKWVGQVR